MPSRLINLLRAGPVDVTYQGASFRFYHQASATECGALFNPTAAELTGSAPRSRNIVRHRRVAVSKHD